MLEDDKTLRVTNKKTPAAQAELGRGTRRVARPLFQHLRVPHPFALFAKGCFHLLSPKREKAL